MMDRTQKLVIEIDPLRATMVLKQEILGVISRKEICPEDLFQAIIHATDRKTFVSSGLLPRGASPSRSVGAVQNGTACSASSATRISHTIIPFMKDFRCRSSSLDFRSRNRAKSVIVVWVSLQMKN